MLEDLKVQSGSVEVLPTWSLLFNDHGYCSLSVNERTGMVMFASDVINGSYSWRAEHTGCPTVYDFLAGRAGVDYLANKILPHAEATAFLSHETAQKVREEVAAALESGRLADIARDHHRAEGEVQDLHEELLDEASEVGPDGYYPSDEMRALLKRHHDDWTHVFVYGETGRYKRGREYLRALKVLMKANPPPAFAFVVAAPATTEGGTP